MLQPTSTPRFCCKIHDTIHGHRLRKAPSLPCQIKGFTTEDCMIEVQMYTIDV